MKEETAVRKSSKPFVKMENGTQAQFRGTKRKLEIKSDTPRQLVSSFFFLFSCKRSFFIVQTRTEVGQITKGTSCQHKATTTHRPRPNIFNSSAQKCSWNPLQPPQHEHNLHLLKPSREKTAQKPELLQKHQRGRGAEQPPSHLLSSHQDKVLIPNKQAREKGPMLRSGYVGENVWLGRYSHCCKQISSKVKTSEPHPQIDECVSISSLETIKMTSVSCTVSHGPSSPHRQFCCPKYSLAWTNYEAMPTPHPSLLWTLGDWKPLLCVFFSYPPLSSQSLYSNGVSRFYLFCRERLTHRQPFFIFLLYI